MAIFNEHENPRGDHAAERERTAFLCSNPDCENGELEHAGEGVYCCTDCWKFYIIRDGVPVAVKYL